MNRRQMKVGVGVKYHSKKAVFIHWNGRLDSPLTSEITHTRLNLASNKFCELSVVFTESH